MRGGGQRRRWRLDVVLERWLSEGMSCLRGPVSGFRSDDGTAQELLSRADVMSLLHGGVLRGDVEVTHAALQWRAFIDRAAAGQREACIGDADACGGDPDRGLRALREQRLVLQRPGERMAPMARDLGPVKRARRPQTAATRRAGRRKPRTSGAPSSPASGLPSSVMMQKPR